MTFLRDDKRRAAVDQPGGPPMTIARRGGPPWPPQTQQWITPRHL